MSILLIKSLFFTIVSILSTWRICSMYLFIQSYNLCSRYNNYNSSFLYLNLQITASILFLIMLLNNGTYCRTLWELVTLLTSRKHWLALICRPRYQYIILLIEYNLDLELQGRIQKIQKRVSGAPISCRDSIYFTENSFSKNTKFHRKAAVPLADL